MFIEVGVTRLQRLVKPVAEVAFVLQGGLIRQRNSSFASGIIAPGLSLCLHFLICWDVKLTVGVGVSDCSLIG